MLKKACFTFALMCVAALAAAQSGQGENLVKILRTSNKAQTNKYVCETFEIKNTNPFDINNFFWAVTSREEGGIYSFANPDCTGGFIVVMCPEYQLETLRKLAKELDRPKLTAAPGSTYIYHRLNHRNISDPQFQSVLSYYLGASGAIYADVETNSVQIFDAKVGAEECRKALIEELDKPLSQVDLKVKVFEVDVNNDVALGNDYLAWKNAGGLTAYFTAQGQSFHADGAPHQHFNTRGSGIYLDYPSAFFDFLVQKGKAKIVTDTQIAATNGQTATLSMGEQILYYAVDTSSSSNLGGDRELNPTLTSMQVGSVTYPAVGNYDSRTISSADTGITLSVIPTIGQQMTQMLVMLDVVNHRGYDNAGTPLLGSRQMTSIFSVANGDEVIMGGLTREREVKAVQKMPFFGSLPVLGYLFASEKTLNQKSIVVCTVSPQMVSGSNFTEEHDTFIKKQTGEEVVALPTSEFCFEQTVKSIY